MRRLTSALSVLALVLGLAVLPSPQPTAAQTTSFSDTAGNTHERNIQRLADRGITRGCAPGRFCPEAPVTRQEMATFLARALELPTTSGRSRFNDVTNPAHSANIEAIADRGITTGVTGRCAVPTQDEGEPAPGDPRFCPLDPVSRNQMAVFLERAFEIETARPIGLNDVDEGGFHAPAIGAALAAGITQGCSPGDRYCGGLDVKRGQMASFLMRALDVVGRTTACPTSTNRQAQVLDFATLGFPVNSAVTDADNDRMYLFTNALSPQRLVVVDTSTTTPTVQRNIEVPGAGSRVWASTIAGEFLYFGRWGTGNNHSFYRVALADLDGDSPNFQRIGTGGLESGSPLDNRVRGNDGQPLTNREFWALTSDDEGRVYAGTGRQEVIYRFTPPEITETSTGTLETARLTGLPGANGKREVTALAWTPSGLVVGTGRGEGIARVVDNSVLLAPSVAPEEASWPSRAISLGSTATDGIFGVYAATVQQPTTDAPGKVLLTTEEDRARLVEIEVPQRPLGDAAAAPLSGASSDWRVPAATPEPILHAPAFAPNGNPVAVGSSTTQLYERTNGLVQRGTPVPASVTRSMVTVDGGTSAQLLGVTANGTVWRRAQANSPSTSTTSLESSPLVTRGPERPQSLAAARNEEDGPFALVGGNNKVTVHALPGPTSTSPRRAARDVTMPGEAKAVVAHGSQVFAATYPGGELRRFNIGPSGSVSATADLVVSWSDTYNRPRDIAYDERNQRLVIAAKSDFEGFGAIISVNRDGTGLREWNTQDILTPRNLASQEPLTVAVTPDGTAVIGTPNGYVTGFDHVNGRKLWEVRPTTASVRGLTVTPDGAIHGVTTTGTRFRIVDGVRGVVTTSPFRGTGGGGASSLLTQSATGQVGEMTLVDGQLVVGSANRLIAVDPGTGAERLLSEGTAPLTFTTRAHAAAVPGSGCQDVLTFRGSGSNTTARVARAPVLRP